MINDPRLTAYALGELPDAERAEFEALIANDAEALAEVESIRALAGELKDQLKAEPIPSGGHALPPVARSRWRALAVAASLAVMGIAAAIAWDRVMAGPSEVAKAGPAVAGTQPTSVPLPEPSESQNTSLATGSQSWDALFGQKVREKTAAGEIQPGQLAPTPVDQTTGDRWNTPQLPSLSIPPTNGLATVTASAATPAESGLLPSLSVSHNNAIPAPAGAIATGGPAPQMELSIRGRSVLADPSVDKLSIARQTLSDSMDAPRGQRGEFNTESYSRIEDNPFLEALSNPLSTFSVDVDTASYANVRRYLNQGTLPPPDAVRVEELINYFPTGDAPPTDGRPFAVYSEVASCPWAPTHQLVRVALKGREIENQQRPVSNLVFLLDVSGSMNEPNKLPLVKQSMQKLVDRLGENDRVAIVVYAGDSGLVLPSTSAMNKEQIRAAIDQLSPGGSTNGAQGIELAYAQAQANFVSGGTNRVILCTDGDFNVGVTDRGQLTRLIEEKAKAGVFLSVLGFGSGNTKDDTMEQLADKGNGNYAYIDTQREAEKVLVKEMSGTLVTIAKDVKLQLEFNPAKVKSYRLIGYENRVLAKEDFNNDLKDAGEIGAGHRVVALYEIQPNRPLTEADRARISGEIDAVRLQVEQIRKNIQTLTDAVRAGTDDGKSLVDLIRQQGDAERRVAALLAQRDVPADAVRPQAATDPLKYQADPNLTEQSRTDELLTLKLRYKAPDAPLEQGTSQLIEFTLADSDRRIETASKDLQFESAVAAFGMLLRESPYKGDARWDLVTHLASQGGGEDREGYQAEFRRLVEIASRLRR